MAETVTDLVTRALADDRGALSRLLTMIESGGETARNVVAKIYESNNECWTVGITGAPGAGKSTLTDRLVGALVADTSMVGVLAIDPTSPFSGGAILGDRIRMQSHTTDPRVFIRSMATRGHLGGLAAATPQAARLLAATGFAWVLIETVGVGQVEVEIADHADTTIVVVNPGWGDAVQANKAGLMEIADIFVVNKADRPGADETIREIESMQALTVATDWRPPIVATSATTGDGVAALASAIQLHRKHIENTGSNLIQRTARVADELRAIVREIAIERVMFECVGPRFDSLTAAVTSGAVDPYTAATRLLDQTTQPD